MIIALYHTQSLLFLKDTTLMGEKRSVYVLAKILKWLTGSTAKSYQCKYGVDQVLGNKHNLQNSELGAALQDVIHYHSIRGKFFSVHPDLSAEGVTGIDICDQGLVFHFGSSGLQNPDSRGWYVGF